jgi:hypothetical protein
MRVLMSVLVALLGAVVGAAIGVAITYALLSGAGADALSWAVLGVVCCVPLTLGGAVATGLLCRQLFPGVFSSGLQGLAGRGRAYGLRGSVVYGIGASMVVLAVGPAAAVHYTTRGTSGPDLLAGRLCRKPGIRFMGTAAQGVTVCFTLTADRNELAEIAWRFSLGSGCGGGGASSYDSNIPLDSPGHIYVPGFTGTIRGARASGVLEDPGVCPGKTFRWSAHEVVP